MDSHIVVQIEVCRMKVAEPRGARLRQLTQWMVALALVPLCSVILADTLVRVFVCALPLVLDTLLLSLL